jgi:16S rRNA (guanine527-N7)-methyltransferase
MPSGGEAARPLACAWQTGLSEEQRKRLEQLVDAVATDEHAPTAVREREGIWRLHVADSLAGLAVTAMRAGRRLADLGSGSGFPGLALAVALPRAEVSLVESQRRKCEYLERICAKAEIANARVVCARVEEWREGLEANDLVVARALAAQPVVLEYAAPLLEVGGVLVDWRGRRDSGEEELAERAAEQLGLRRLEVRHTKPYVGAREHHLHVFEKETPTPERFPRRPGAARKRPLGC